MHPLPKQMEKTVTTCSMALDRSSGQYAEVPSRRALRTRQTLPSKAMSKSAAGLNQFQVVASGLGELTVNISTTMTVPQLFPLLRRQGIVFTGTDTAIGLLDLSTLGTLCELVDEKDWWV